MTPATPHIVPWWTLQRADDAIVATAIHDGSGLRAEVAAAMVLPQQERLREEDPFTGQAILDVPTHVIPHRSRFEVDLNRAEADAVYLTPDQCWGLEVWREPPDPRVVAESRRYHRAFYTMLSDLLDPQMEAMRGFDFLGRNLDVRENVAFQGRGELARFVHARYPDTGCAIALEFKKFYMDEWTGEPDPAALPGMRGFIRQTADACRGLLHG